MTTGDAYRIHVLADTSPIGPAHTLTPGEFASMSEQQRKLRRLQWERIVDVLALDHERRYHSPRRAVALRLELLAHTHHEETL
jgi:hypothetical protein